MKKALITLSLLATVFSAVSCNTASTNNTASNAGAAPVAQKGAVVYFNLDKILTDYDLANDLRSVVETKVNGINEEVTRRQNKLQSDAQAFQEKVNKGLITSSVAEVQYQNLQKQDQDFQQYAAQKEQEINEELSVMQNQIADAVNSFIKTYNEEKQYAMIIATQGDIISIPVVTADSDLDITEDILAGLNAEYIKNKNKK